MKIPLGRLHKSTLYVCGYIFFEGHENHAKLKSPNIVACMYLTHSESAAVLKETVFVEASLKQKQNQPDEWKKDGSFSNRTSKIAECDDI